MKNGTYKKPAGNIILDGKRLVAILPKIRKEARISTLIASIQHFSQCNKARKEIIGIWIGKKEVRLSPLALT